MILYFINHQNGGHNVAHSRGSVPLHLFSAVRDSQDRERGRWDATSPESNPSSPYASCPAAAGTVRRVARHPAVQITGLELQNDRTRRSCDVEDMGRLSCSDPFCFACVFDLSARKYMYSKGKFLIECMKYENPNERIVGMRIPDEDAHNWVRHFAENGYSNEEIDSLMTRMNETYLTQQYHDFIEQMVTHAVEQIETKRGQVVTGELREKVRQSLIDFIRTLDPKTLEGWTKSK